MATTRIRATPLPTVLTALLAAACGGGEGADDGPGAGLSGTLQIDGSSTVFPVSEAVAEDFMLRNQNVRVTVGQSGTGGGFKRFCAGETAISDASREIRPEEVDLCAAAGIEYLELPVAVDGLSVVTHPETDFVTCLTTDELRRIWEPDSAVSSWADVRPDFPDLEMSLYGPGTDSGTFDYFTEAVVGQAKASRTDFQASEDDNVLVQGVSGDEGSLGYFGYAYVVENRDRLELLAVNDGGGCVEPSDATIEDGTYPLARPLFIYVRADALARPEVRAFVDFYMTEAPELVPATGYYPMAPERYRQNLDAVAAAASPGAGA